MEDKKILVVYYSRTGTTRIVGEKIRKALNCDSEEIYDTKKRSGILGFMSSGRDSLFKRETVIEDIKRDPKDYDLIIMGTPVWAGNMSAAMRTYINKYRDKFNNIAFFSTEGNSGSEATLDSMKELCQKSPIAVLTLDSKKIKRGNYVVEIEEFCGGIMGQEKIL